MKNLLGPLSLMTALAACERVIDVRTSLDPVPSASPSVGPVTTPTAPEAPELAAAAPKVICGGLTNKRAARGNGLVANLYYAASEAQGKTWNASGDYLRDGIVSDATLLMPDLNLPTQPFSIGFRYGNEPGEYLRNNDGAKLFEWFAIHARSTLQLTANQAEGAYQFALLSDDGATAYLDGQTLVANEGPHATKMACSGRSVDLAHGVPHEFELTYFQGPRVQIALMLLWRPAPSAGAIVADASCGKTTSYFDSNSAPLAPYRDLQARGWQPVPGANFLLPEEAADADAACHP